MRSYDPRDWYWVVAGSTTQVYASARKAYVPVADAAYAAFIAVGNSPTHIDTEANLRAVLWAARVPMLNDTLFDELEAALASDPLITQLRTATPAQIATWINSNVTDLPTARIVLARLAVAVSYLWHRGN